jgi:hypothetical protein
MGLWILLASVVGAMSPSESAARLLTGAAAEGASAVERADVVTTEDLRLAMNLEAGKQALTCETSSSCLAEIAAAMDAELVVSTTVLPVGEGFTAQWTLYDVKRAVSFRRDSVKAPSIDVLATLLKPAIRAQVDAFVAPRPPELRVRVLVLDVDARGVAAVLDRPAPAPPHPAPVEPKSVFGWWSGVGGGLATLGVVGVVGGSVLLGIADQANAALAADPPLAVADQLKQLDTRDQVLVPGLATLVVGGALTLAGAGVVVFDGVTE